MSRAQQTFRNKEELKSYCRSYTGSALKVLDGIMNDAHSPPASRVNAAEILIQYGWGKPDEHHSHDLNVRYVLESLPDNEWSKEYGPKRISNGNGNGHADKAIDDLDIREESGGH